MHCEKCPQRGRSIGLVLVVSMVAAVSAAAQTAPSTSPAAPSTRPAGQVPAWAQEEVAKVVDEMLDRGRWVLPVPVTQAGGTAPPAGDLEGLTREVVALLALVWPSTDGTTRPSDTDLREQVQLAREFLKNYNVNWHPVAVYLEYRDGQRPLTGRRLQVFAMLMDAHVDRVMAGLRVKNR